MEFWKPDIEDGKSEIQIRFLPNVNDTFPRTLPIDRKHIVTHKPSECPMCKLGIPKAYVYGFTIDHLISSIKNQPSELFLRHMNLMGRLISIKNKFRYTNEFQYTHKSENRNVACYSLIAGLNNLSVEQLTRMVTN